MVWRIATLVWGLLGTAGIVLYVWGGQIPAGRVLQGLAVLGTLAALWMVVKLPWDLYFSARYVVTTQRTSVDRDLAVSLQERQEARILARRLLAFSLGLHLAGAAVCAGVSVVTQSPAGPVAAGAFILSMVVRPTGAMVVHVRRRLTELAASARIPREDARALDGRVARLEEDLSRRTLEAPERHAARQAVHERLTELRAALAAQEHRHRADVDRLAREFERSIERLTSDKDILAGLRAFLVMVRQSPS